jgi:hypothetical protein
MSKEKDKVAITIDQITESPYVLGVRKHEQYKVIDVQLQMDWIIPEYLFPEDTPYYMNEPNEKGICSFYSETKQFSDIYNIINEVVRYNKELEEKTLIFNKLQMELQKMFDTMDLNGFKTVTITTNSNARIVPPIAKEDKKNDGEILKP